MNITKPVLVLFVLVQNYKLSLLVSKTILFYLYFLVEIDFNLAKQAIQSIKTSLTKGLFLNPKRS